MGLKVFLKMASFITIMALLYIHMQMKIFELAYRGKEKEKRIHELSDTNGALTHQILTLKSANHLGNQLLDKESGLQFMGGDKVITLRSPAGSMRRPSELPKQKIENSFWNLLSLVSSQVAQAGEE